MTPTFNKPPDTELRLKLRWLIVARAVFSTLLLGSTVFIHLSGNPGEDRTPFLVLYGIILAIYFLSALYGVLLVTLRRVVALAYVQIGIDTIVVSMIVYLTGSFSSIFAFLYPVVLIYTSMLLYRRGSFIMAAVSAIEYSALVGLEFFGALKPILIGEGSSATRYELDYVVYRVLITVGACFAVAFLSSILAEQARRTREELTAMEEQVRRVEKMAAVGEMGAGLAHEIKNPLASITGAIQLLRDEMVYEPGVDKLMQIILREADRLSTLVSNFLLFARPPSGDRQPICLDTAIPETVALFEKNEKYRERIRIKCNGESNLWIEMDPDHFRQVLWNLLVNAAEAIADVGRIEIHSIRSRNQTVHIRVSDTGCGMAPATISSIFDPFFTTKASGTGLGLSIVLRIVESYDGRLEVKSAPGAGTDFFIKLKSISDPSLDSSL